MTWIQTLVLALLQGVTELFPISSLGHTVIVPGLLGWTSLVESKTFLPVVVAFHLGTSVALVCYFWRDWWHVIRTLLRSIQEGQVKRGDESWISWLVIIGCIPAGLLGVLLEKPLKHLFASPLIAAAFLAVNGLLLLLGEALRRRTIAKTLANKVPVSVANQPVPAYPGGFPQGQNRGTGFAQLTWEQSQISTMDTVPLPVTGKASRPLTSLTWKEAIIIGFAQSLALIPGISRSGSTMVASLSVGLSHEDAAHFSFLLGTPLILAAALLEIPQLAGAAGSTLVLVFIGMVLSGLAAFLSTKFLMRYFETGRLNPFAYYCLAFGIISLVLFIMGVGVR